MDNRIAMIINGVIGDVYGAPIEMMPLEVIHERYGKLLHEYIVTDKVIERKYTDDSEMTLGTLDFINENKELIKLNIMNSSETNNKKLDY